MRRAADDIAARVVAAAGSPSYIVLHLRLEQDVIDAGVNVPTPAAVVARMGELVAVRVPEPHEEPGA